MKNSIKSWVRELRQILSLFKKAAQLRGITTKFQGLLYLSIERDNQAGRRIRKWIQPIHEALMKSSDGLISLRLQLAGHSKCIFLRKGNFGDYQVAGELLDEVYRSPSFAPQVVYDCGANIGIFSLYAASCFPAAKIICFEPDKNNLALLRKNLLANGITAEIREAGVWDKNGTIYYHPGDSSILGMTNEQPSPFPIRVERLEIATPDTWVKLDVEGAEYQVLPTLLRSHPLPRHISIELHFYDTKGQQIIELFKAGGYQLHGYFDPQNICAVFDAELSQN